MSDNGAAARFHLAGPEIISETFDDGESVVVNLENGFYFSLNPLGGLVFDLLGSGVSLAAAETAVGARYEAEPDAICAALAEFAARLVDEGLLAVGAPSERISADGGLGRERHAAGARRGARRSRAVRRPDAHCVHGHAGSPARRSDPRLRRDGMAGPDRRALNGSRVLPR